MSKLLVTIILMLLFLSPVSHGTGALVVNSQAEIDHFTISLLWPDGVLVPFAEYQEGKWLNPWPKAEHSTEEEPNTIADLSKPWFAQNKKPSAKWYFWSSDGVLHVFKAAEIVKADSHCQSVWGLLSDLPKEAKESDRPGNIGVALDVKRQIDGMIEIPKTSDEWNSFVSFIQPSFEREEVLNVAELNSCPGFPLAEDRKKVGIKLSHVYRSNAEINGQYLCYFEAQKELVTPIPPSDERCSHIFFRGWMIKNSRGDLNRLETQIGWVDCDHKGENSRVPLGTLTIGDRVFVITYDPGYESESYSIFELSESGISLVLETVGGSC
jgi:hypothetical protein